MQRYIWGVLSLGTVCILLSTAGAQPPERPGRPPDRDGAPPPPNPVVEALDTDHDGVLSADEIRAASESLKKLDRNGDGKLTEDELHPQRGPGRPPGHGAGEAGPRERSRGGPEARGGDRAGPPPGGPDGRRRPGPPDQTRDGAGGAGAGRTGAGGPKRGDRAGGPPSVLPPFVRDELRLTQAQQRQLDDLDADVRARLDRILTDDQRHELERMRQRAPAGPPQGDDRPGPPDGRDRGRRPDGAGRPGQPQRPSSE
jgi:hypothetical protein